MTSSSLSALPVPHPLRKATTLALLATLFLPAAQAQTSPDSHWAFSGFGSLGATEVWGAHDWGLQRSSAQRGAGSDTSLSQDSRLGVQLDWRASDKWDGGVQAVAMNKPSGTPFAENIEWGYLGYRPTPNSRLRLGRNNPDIFLFADSRNVGFALPWARPPIDFYGFAPIVSIDGADLEQRWTTGDSNWRLRATAGSFKTGVTDSQGARLAARGRDAWALGLTREDGGLLLKASYLRARIQLDMNDDVAALRNGLQQVSALGLPGLASSLAALDRNLWTGGLASYIALAAQYDSGPWTWVAEASDLSVPRSPLGGRRAYASVGYRRGVMTLYGLVSRVLPKEPAATAPALITSLTPVIGNEGAQQAQMLADYAAEAGLVYRFDQTTLGVGLRWDVADNTALKVQLDHFDVRRAGGAGWRYADARPASGQVLSLLVDFTWGS